ncbi:hypothetical protein [Sulfitobacter aestuariivivens]|uniref:hypothetical protein n=1 Tax=Sulfitobacter aestuariivivens TaxID=2766981 RepID=UPI001FE4850D|nr:hypothetical protein [Sulfitobacter aestuariivivens]
MDDFTYQRSGRSWAGLIVIGVVWCVLLVLYGWFDAAWWIVLALAAFTIPAVLDLLHDTQSGLRLSDDTLSWFTGKRDADVALSQIHHVRLDTRLDFSVRASLVLKSGRKLRLPFEATPPHEAFEKALQARGMKVERHHFQLFQ